jgi:cold shock CspA family protein
MPRGRLRFYNEKEAYGFIERDTPGQDVFVHLRDIDAESTRIEEGLAVQFDIRTSERGPRAIAVEPAES